MTEAEKNVLINDLEHIKKVLMYGCSKDAVVHISTVIKTISESVDDIDDWSESVEARLTNLEKRVSMINAFYVAKEVEENERRKAREKPFYACRRHGKRAFCRQNYGI